MKIVINEGPSFLITNEWGDIPSGSEMGLYDQDTRFLSHLELMMGELRPQLLTSKQVSHHQANYYLTNPDFDGINHGTIGLVRRCFVGQGLHGDIDITNYNQQPCSFPLELRFDVDFADIFEVKTDSLLAKRAYGMEIGKDKLSCSFTYRRKDFIRKTVIRFSEQPHFTKYGVVFEIKLDPQEKWHLCLNFLTLTSNKEVKPRYSCALTQSTLLVGETEAKRCMGTAPEIVTDYDDLKHAYEQSLVDLGALRLQGSGISGTETVPAAGIPWFMTFFGRDSLIVGYQTLMVCPELALGALDILAKHQGRKVNRYRAEEPGKILHEIRFGELATFRQVPHTPYYGTIDATPLFLILLSEVFRWTGDTRLIESFKDNALRALEWIDKYGDSDGDGYLEYIQETGKGLANQGWKDSWNAIQFSDGKLAKPPIALCEVQGYVYDGKVRLAELMEVWGESEKARCLREEARDLKRRFNDDFWMEEKNYFALALDGNKNKVDAVASNVGHLLWSGIVQKRKAKLVVKKLFSPEMFSGWGIRSLSMAEKGYNPISYHNGSVWPHDNSLIAAGLMKYGFYKEARKIFSGILKASSNFFQWRLPELFCGYPKKETQFPVEYPTSSSPQAWSSGAVCLLLTLMAGLSVNMTKRVVGIRPVLPPKLSRLKIEDIKIGSGLLSLDLTVDKKRVKTEVLKKPKDIEVKVLEGDGRSRG